MRFIENIIKAILSFPVLIAFISAILLIVSSHKQRREEKKPLKRWVFWFNVFSGIMICFSAIYSQYESVSENEKSIEKDKKLSEQSGMLIRAQKDLNSKNDILINKQNIIIESNNTLLNLQKKVIIGNSKELSLSQRVSELQAQLFDQITAKNSFPLISASIEERPHLTRVTEPYLFQETIAFKVVNDGRYSLSGIEFHL